MLLDAATGEQVRRNSTDRGMAAGTPGRGHPRRHGRLPGPRRRQPGRVRPHDRAGPARAGGGDAPSRSTTATVADGEPRRSLPRLPALPAGRRPAGRDRAARPGRPASERSLLRLRMTFFTGLLAFADDSRHVVVNVFDDRPRQPARARYGTSPGPRRWLQRAAPGTGATAVARRPGRPSRRRYAVARRPCSDRRVRPVRRPHAGCRRPRRCTAGAPATTRRRRSPTAITAAGVGPRAASGRARRSGRRDAERGSRSSRSDGRLAVLSPLTGERALDAPVTAAPGARAQRDRRRADAGGRERDRHRRVASNPVSPRPDAADRGRRARSERRCASRRPDSPAVEPGRGCVAYGISCDGNGLGFTSLATGANYRSDALGGRSSPRRDRRLRRGRAAGLVAGRRRGSSTGCGSRASDAAGYCVGRLWPAVRQATDRGARDPGRATRSRPRPSSTTTPWRSPSATRPHPRSTGCPSARRAVRPSGLDSSACSQTATGTSAFRAGITPAGRRPERPPLPGGHRRRPPLPLEPGRAEPTKLADGVTAATWLPWYAAGRSAEAPDSIGRLTPRRSKGQPP